MHRVALVVALAVASLPADALVAQQSTPQFEVASVRPQTTPRTVADVTAWIRPAPGGRLAGSHSTLMRLITYAYDMKEFQVIGPDWIRSSFYAVDAKAPSQVPVEQLRLMLRSLLEERFAFAAHQAQREMPYLALVVAGKSGRPGPRLRQLDAEACAGRPDLQAIVREKLPGIAVPSRNRIAGACVELSDLAQQVGFMLGTLVIDKTGLGRGLWVFDAPHGALPPRGVLSTLAVPRPGEAAITRASGELPSYTDALEEQLGLKLEPARGPVDVLVIDSVSEPTAN